MRRPQRLREEPIPIVKKIGGIHVLKNTGRTPFSADRPQPFIQEARYEMRKRIAAARADKSVTSSFCREWSGQKPRAAPARLHSCRPLPSDSAGGGSCLAHTATTPP